MKRTALLMLIMILLSGCKPAAETPVPETAMPAAPPAEAITPPEPTPTMVLPPELAGDIQVQQLMLTSHTRWQTLDIGYVMTAYPAPGAEGEPQITKHQIAISQPASFKVVISKPDGSIVTTRISDGKTIVDSSGEVSQVPNYVFEPFNPPSYPSDTVYPHPLAGYLGSAASDLVFPAGLAQRGGSYNQTGTETILGRQANVVEWSREAGQVIDRFWVDAQTGVILRQQSYGKELSASPLYDIQAEYVTIDQALAADLFDANLVPTPPPTAPAAEPGTASITVLELKGILNVRSGPNTAYKVVTTIEPGKTYPVIGRNEAGDWWKIQLEGEEGWVFGPYVEFSGDQESVPVMTY